MPWRPTFARLVNAVETIPAGMRAAGAVDLSPGVLSCLIQYWRRLLRRDVDGPIRRSRADGALEGEEMARDPGGPCVGYRRAASNGADREAGLKAPTLSAQTPQMSGLPRAGGKLAAEPRKRRDAGAERQRVGAGNRPVMVAE